ncbi:hypothetical protein AGLY_007488, partial [Aphis glycines]
VSCHWVGHRNSICLLDPNSKIYHCRLKVELIFAKNIVFNNSNLHHKLIATVACLLHLFYKLITQQSASCYTITAIYIIIAGPCNVHIQYYDRELQRSKRLDEFWIDLFSLFYRQINSPASRRIDKLKWPYSNLNFSSRCIYDKLQIEGVNVSSVLLSLTIVDKYVEIIELTIILVSNSRIGFREGLRRCVCRSHAAAGRLEHVGQPAGADSESSTPPRRCLCLLFFFLVNLSFHEAVIVIVLSFTSDPSDARCYYTLSYLIFTVDGKNETTNRYNTTDHTTLLHCELYVNVEHEGMSIEFIMIIRNYV